MRRFTWTTVGVIAAAALMIVSSVAIFGAAAGPAAAPGAAPSVASAVSPTSGSVASASVAPSTTTVAIAPSAAASAPSFTPAQVATMLAPSGVWNGPLAIDQQKANAVQSVVSQATASGIASSDLFPPNLYEPAAPPSETGNHIVPTYPYPNSPAPLGLGFYGLRNVSGQLTGSLFNTTAVAGSFSTGDNWGVQSLYYDYGGQQTYGSQLNAVLNNVTVQGQDGNQMWIQNVINYNTIGATTQLSFIINIWNFSSSAISMSSNSLLEDARGPISHTSSVYEASGPSITVHYPFSFTLYENTTVNYQLHNAYGNCQTYGCNLVYFNYSIYNGLGQRVCPTPTSQFPVCGSYDNVTFNSQPSSHHVPIQLGSAEFVANGLAYNPYVNLPDDFEWDYAIGDSSGALVNIQYADATLGLLYLNSSTGRMQEVPSAYNYGSETGENGQGASIGWSTGANGQPYGLMRTGPGILQGLWNISGTPSGVYPVNYAGVTPGNAFIAYAPGAAVTNQSMFKVAPTFGWFTPRGSLGANTYLTPGTYTVEILLSDYTMQTQTITLTSAGATLSASLVRNDALGVYTPLWAFSTSDLANLSVSGSGTAVSPFIMPGNSPSSLSLVFSDVSSYIFPVWLGIYLNGTTSYVNFDPAPTLSITYPSWAYISKVQTYFAPTAASVPLENQFQMYFYHAQNVTVAHAASIGGWFSNEEVGRKYNVYVNDGKNFLFYADNFNVSSEGLDFLSGGTNNYVWGSTFTPWSDPAAYPGIETPSTGLTLAESGDHVFNNIFETNGTASASASYLDFWNASGGYQSASNSWTVNGYTLSGSILGQSIQGGNYWRNYGSVADPYGVPYVARSTSPTGSAGIGKGADYAPLTAYTPVALGATVPGALGVGLYSVQFSEQNLGIGESWTMRIAGVPVAAPGGTVAMVSSPTNTTAVTSLSQTSTFWIPNGTYTWSLVSGPTGSVPTQTYTGTVTVDGASVVVTPPIIFAWTLTVKETGLTSGLAYATTIGGVLKTTTASHWLNYTELPGAYTFTAGAIPTGWVVTPASGTVTVTLAAKTLNLTFASSHPSFTIYFTASGIYSGTSWSVTISGNTESSTGSLITFTEPAGTYSYTVTAPAGYSATPASGSVTVSTVSTSVGIAFTLNTYTVTFTESGLPGGTMWAVTLGGVLQWSTSTTVTFQVAAGGTFTYYIGYLSGYPTSTPTGSTGPVTGPLNVPITFT